MPLTVPELRWDTYDPSLFVLRYDKGEDTLYIQLPEARPATSIDLDEEVWIRVDPESGEIVGWEVEDFEKVFLKKHPELAIGWQESRRRDSRDKVAAVLAILLNFLGSLVNPPHHPQQPRLLSHS